MTRLQDAPRSLSYLPKTKIYYRQTRTATVLFYSRAVQTGPVERELDPGVELEMRPFYDDSGSGFA